MAPLAPRTPAAVAGTRPVGRAEDERRRAHGGQLPESEGR